MFNNCITGGWQDSLGMVHEHGHHGRHVSLLEQGKPDVAADVVGDAAHQMGATHFGSEFL